MRKRTKTILIASLLIIILAAGGTYYYVFIFSRHNHRQVKNEKAILIGAEALASQFSADEAAANARYLDKTLAVKGTVLEAGVNNEGKTTLLLQGDTSSMTHVFCTLTQEVVAPPLLSEITVKGICTGLLSDVILVDALLTENTTHGLSK
ncbi:MAG: OB-fold protein [Chitinophagaceae bacterium]